MVHWIYRSNYEKFEYIYECEQSMNKGTSPMVHKKHHDMVKLNVYGFGTNIQMSQKSPLFVLEVKESNLTIYLIF